MLDASAALLEVLRGSYTMKLHVNSWRGGDLLYAEVPVASGNLTMDRSMNVPERLTLSVPRVADDFSWVPSDSDHPLSPYGQVLQVTLGIDVGGTEEILRLGWYLITETSTAENTINVSAEGMFKFIDEARFTAPFDPAGTFIDTVQALVEPALTVTFEGLTNRNVPLSMKWDEDRLSALNEVIDAWPAEAYVTEDGYVRVMPVPSPVAANSVWDITDDPTTGTVIRWASETTREGAYNVVVARGEAASGEPVQGVELDLDVNSATYFGGPFNALPVPFFFYSPLMSTVAQCVASAQSIMQRKRRARSKNVAVELVPNPTLRLGDVVTVTNDELDHVPGTIETISLPLNPGGGNMSMTLSLTVGA